MIYVDEPQLRFRLLHMRYEYGRWHTVDFWRVWYWDKPLFPWW